VNLNDEYIDPTCDACDISSEDATEWCGNCGNCMDHCADFEGCDERVCSECGYPLINDPDVVIEYGPQCGDCGGPAKTIT